MIDYNQGALVVYFGGIECCGGLRTLPVKGMTMSIWGVIKEHKVIAGLAVAVSIGAAYAVLAGSIDEPVVYTYTAITKGEVESTISSSGTVNPVTEITVGTQVSGTIERVYVDFNDKVKKGQIIAVLDSALLKMSVSVAEADLMKAEAQFEEAQLNHGRSEQLSAKDLISASEFQAVKTALKTAQAGSMNARTSLKRALQNLHYSVIRAPITGTVTARNIEAGQTVAAAFSTPTLFTIAEDMSKMEITASVDESDIGRIENGQAVRFGVQTYPGKVFQGMVKQVRLKPTTASNVLLIANAALRFQPTDAQIADAEKRGRGASSSGSDSLQAVRVLHHDADEGIAELKRIWLLDAEGN